MHSLVRSFDRFFQLDHRDRVIDFFGRAVGLYYLIFLISIWPNWNFFFAGNGASAHLGRGYFDFFGYFQFIPFSLLWLLGFVIAVQQFRGRHLAITSVLLFGLHAFLLQRNSLATNGEDLVIRMLLFYSMFFPWKGEGAWRGAWALRMAQLNLMLIYLLSLPKKLAGDVSWWNGDVMYYVFANPSWSRIHQWPPQVLSALSEPSTYLTLIIELCGPILIWTQRFRLPMTLLLMMFHFLISCFLLNVSYFSWSMILGLTLFLQDQEITSLQTAMRNLLTAFRPRKALELLEAKYKS